MRFGRLEIMRGDVLLVASDGLRETEAENGEVFEDLQLHHNLNKSVDEYIGPPERYSSNIITLV
jgi:serine phosphatase RsbU (regulator of sigma subunit)